ncbi:Nucleotide-binding universal stress protein, UspA family [Lentzea xinjiangensis]|uniref:Nucleotide-binding universal stress protein, UspA family n=1 Tax=Lentzea xinjiangensis TaxID=402600 RepID=A0A1H9UEZ5_9PSEU|nr:universal stress protein [Lentzea xinjiangensis]SES07734.1 Nucleotide-binding universal stress protein, UspA family [Lentzea xinjiangensis]
MNTTSPIIVGIDGTPMSEQALRWAMDEALVRDCPLHIVHAWTYEPLVDWTQADASRGLAGSEALLENALCAAAAGRTDVPEVVRRSIRGAAGEVLEELSVGAAMLVVAPHGGRWLNKTMLGSTSAHCVRHSSAPVVVIPAQREARSRASGAADHEPLTSPPQPVDQGVRQAGSGSATTPSTPDWQDGAGRTAVQPRTELPAQRR